MRILLFIIVITALVRCDKIKCVISENEYPEMVDNLVDTLNHYPDKSTQGFMRLFEKFAISYMQQTRIKECFIVNENDQQEIYPIFQIENLENYKKIAIAMENEDMLKYVKSLEYIKEHGFTSFCATNMTNTNSRVLNIFIYGACAINEFYIYWKPRKPQLSYHNSTSPHTITFKVDSELKRTSRPIRRILQKRKKNEKYKKAVKKIKDDFNNLKLVNTLIPTVGHMLKDQGFWTKTSEIYQKRVAQRRTYIKKAFYDMVDSIHNINIPRPDFSGLTRLKNEIVHLYESNELRHRFNFVYQTLKDGNVYYFSDYYKSKEHQDVLKSRRNIFGSSILKTKKQQSYSILHGVSSLFHYGKKVVNFGSVITDTSILFTGLGPLDSNIFNVFIPQNYWTAIQGIFRWSYGQDCDEANCKYCFPYFPASENNCKWIEFVLITGSFWGSVDPNALDCADYQGFFTWIQFSFYYITNDLFISLINANPIFGFLTPLLYNNGILPSGLGFCLFSGLINLYYLVLGLGTSLILLAAILMVLRESNVADDIKVLQRNVRRIKTDMMNMKKTEENVEQKIRDEMELKIESLKEEYEERFNLQAKAILELHQNSQ